MYDQFDRAPSPFQAFWKFQMILGPASGSCLFALLAALFADLVESAFVIGLGTGMTVGALAALDTVERVVVAEISAGVVEAGRFFEPYNRGALTSPKTVVIRSDAYRALLRDEARYDMIVSEPSNPWVSGVEML